MSHLDLRTYKARSLHEALRLVRADLGDDAAVLHTREIPTGFLSRWWSSPQVEVTASAEVDVPSRFSDETIESEVATPTPKNSPAADTFDFRNRIRTNLDRSSSPHAPSLDDLARQIAIRTAQEQPQAETWSYAKCHAWLTKQKFVADYANELLTRLTSANNKLETSDTAWKEQLVPMIASDITLGGALARPTAGPRVVALVGPTGVGKTTTIAKLAAHHRLREKWRVGLITVDTYRIAAVEQLRTYADIMDLPMEIVTSPREMRSAVGKLADMDLILIDTAGRSPRDEVRVRELKSVLTEAAPDEVHLVLSAVASEESMISAIDRFQPVGVSRLLISKLDETDHLASVLTPILGSKLPLSYTTHGQTVPDDISVADGLRLAKQMLQLT